jgi:hypothetical protein
MMHLFNRLGQKVLSDFVPEYLAPEIEYSTNSSRTRKIQVTQHPLTWQALRGWWWGLVPRVPPTWTQKAQGGVRYNSTHHPEDSRGSWHAPQGVKSYIYRNICKIGKYRWSHDWDHIVTDSVTFLLISPPLDIKRGVEAPPKELEVRTSLTDDNHNINCHKRYKNIGRRAIILREAWNYLKILTSPVLPSFSRSHDHPYSKSLSQTTIVLISWVEPTTWLLLWSYLLSSHSNEFPPW